MEASRLEFYVQSVKLIESLPHLGHLLCMCEPILEGYDWRNQRVVPGILSLASSAREGLSRHKLRVPSDTAPEDAAVSC